MFLGAGVGGLITGVFGMYSTVRDLIIAGTQLAFVIDALSYLLSALLTLLLWRYPMLDGKPATEKNANATDTEMQPTVDGASKEHKENAPDAVAVDVVKLPSVGMYVDHHHHHHHLSPPFALC